jgi:hypothetical protein
MASIKRSSRKTSGKVTSTRLYEKPWRDLSPKQKRIRRDSLTVLRSARRNPDRSLTRIIRKHNKTAEKRIAMQTVLNNTGAFAKKNKRWIAKQSDAIPRSMLMAENGRMVSIETRNSEEASKIGRYHRAVQKLLDDGEYAKLGEFDGMTVTDSDGMEHLFETDEKKVREVNAIARGGDYPQVYLP